MTIIHNMTVLSECKDARDKASLAWKYSKSAVPIPSGRPPLPDPFDVFDSSARVRHVNGSMVEQEEANSQQSILLHELDKDLGVRFRSAVDVCFTQHGQLNQAEHDYGTVKVLTDEM